MSIDSVLKPIRLAMQAAFYEEEVDVVIDIDGTPRVFSSWDIIAQKDFLSHYLDLITNDELIEITNNCICDAPINLFSVDGLQEIQGLIIDELTVMLDGFTEEIAEMYYEDRRNNSVCFEIED